MRYIISASSEYLCQLNPYTIMKIDNQSVVVELTDSQVEALYPVVKAIEPDFALQFDRLSWDDLGTLSRKKVLIVTVGKYFSCPNIHYLYEIDEKRWVAESNECEGGVWIHCYSKTGEISVSQALDTLKKFCKLSILTSKPLIVVGKIKSKLPYFSHDSLAEKIALTQLAQYNSLLVLPKVTVKGKPFHQSYFTKVNSAIVYSNEPPKLLQKTLKKWLDYKQDGEAIKRQTDEVNLLYDSLFYSQIPPQQKIYVPITALTHKTCEAYRALGLNPICIGERYIFLYNERQLLDQNKMTLIEEVSPNLDYKILTRAPLQNIRDQSRLPVIHLGKELDYTGEDVYIGIITEEGVDYTRSFLRKENQNTRIAMYWIQEEGEQGTYYLEDQINEALLSNTFNESVPLAKGETYTTTLLGLAGGSLEADIGSVATGASFLVAKVQSAPKVLQSIYGGSTQDKAVLMPDLLIASYKLLEKAKQDHKPLVLILPYNTNLSAHDGSDFYEQILEVMGRQRGCSIVVPTGEEANKKHHQVIAQAGRIEPYITLQANEMAESLVGRIYFRGLLSAHIGLYGPSDREKGIQLESTGTYFLMDGTVYTEGKLYDDQNGAWYIPFKIENMKSGIWYLRCDEKVDDRPIEIDIWLAQQSLNPYVTLVSSSPFSTLGSNAAIGGLMSVGGYDPKNLVLFASSGRGYNWVEQITPYCIANGKAKMLTATNEVYNIEGSVVSCAFVAGLLALIYEKWKLEISESYANTLIMKELLYPKLKHLTGSTYPNRGQGYGILDIEGVAEVLSQIY